MQKTLRQQYYSSTSPRYRGKMEQILLTYSIPKETVATIMMHYKNTKVKNLLTGWRHRLLRHCSRCATRRHISPIPYVLITSIDLMKENGYKLVKERSRRYSAQTITDVDCSYDIALLANTLAQAESLLHSLERAAGGIGLLVNVDKTEYMRFNQRGDISTLKSGPLKLVDKFTYVRSSVFSNEKDINTLLAKAWTAIDRLSVIWKTDLTDKIKRSFFPAAVVTILLYGCTTWMLTKRIEKKFEGNYTRMLRAVLNKSQRQHPTKQLLYGHLPPIMKTIKVRRTRHAGHYWRSNDELISDIYLWTSSHGRTKAGRPAGTYIQQLCADTGCSLKDLPGAMDDRDGW